MSDRARVTVSGVQSLFFLLALACAGASARAATLTVTHFGDDIYCDAVGCSLRGALLNARNGDTIVWANGLSYPATTTLSDTIVGRPLLVLAGVTVQGPGADKLSIDAQQASRVFNIDTRINQNYSVSISGVTLSNGRTVGTSFYNGQCTNGSGIFGPGRAGGPGDGGCIWADASTSLTLQGVTLTQCEAFGGLGESGRNTDETFAPPPHGGNGGAARGGAIFSLGNLVLREVSMHHTAVSGGQGGSGGFAVAVSGHGGDGGYASGGAVWVAGSMEWRNVSTADVRAYGGWGGDRCGVTGNPPLGAGGDVYGGVVAMFEPTTISFSTLELASIQAGQNVLATRDGTIYGNVLNSPGTVVINHSVLNAAVGNGDVEASCTGALIVAAGSQSRGPCADATVNPLGTLTPRVAANGIMTLVPEASSPLIDAASSCLDAQSNLVSIDARGAPRPYHGACDLGAHESDERIFANGFE